MIPVRQKSLPTISGKQVNLLLAFFIKAGLRSTNRQLEYIEYECGYLVNKLEDLNTGQFSIVISKLRSQFDLDA